MDANTVAQMEPRDSAALIDCYQLVLITPDGEAHGGFAGLNQPLPPAPGTAFFMPGTTFTAVALREVTNAMSQMSRHAEVGGQVVMNSVRFRFVQGVIGISNGATFNWEENQEIFDTLTWLTNIDGVGEALGKFGRLLLNDIRKMLMVTDLPAQREVIRRINNVTFLRWFMLIVAQDVLIARNVEINAGGENAVANEMRLLKFVLLNHPQRGMDATLELGFQPAIKHNSLRNWRSSWTKYINAVEGVEVRAAADDVDSHNVQDQEYNPSSTESHKKEYTQTKLRNSKAGGTRLSTNVYSGQDAKDHGLKKISRGSGSSDSSSAGSASSAPRRRPGGKITDF